MSTNSTVRNLILASALAVAIPAFAKPVVKDLPINHSMHVGQTSIESGDYRILIDGNHLTIQKGKKVVAQSDGRWEERSSKSPYDEILSDANGNMMELRFAGKTGVFVLAR